jgi:hypothetical protein
MWVEDTIKFGEKWIGKGTFADACVLQRDFLFRYLCIDTDVGPPVSDPPRIYKCSELHFPRRMVSSGMLRRMALVGADVSEELIASLIRVTASVVPRSSILFSWWRRRYVPPKRRLLQETHGVTSQETLLFLVTNVKTSNLKFIFLNAVLFLLALKIVFAMAVI